MCVSLISAERVNLDEVLMLLSRQNPGSYFWEAPLCGSRSLWPGLSSTCVFHVQHCAARSWFGWRGGRGGGGRLNGIFNIFWIDGFFRETCFRFLLSSEVCCLLIVSMRSRFTASWYVVISGALFVGGGLSRRPCVCLCVCGSALVSSCYRP